MSKWKNKSINDQQSWQWTNKLGIIAARNLCKSNCVVLKGELWAKPDKYWIKVLVVIEIL